MLGAVDFLKAAERELRAAIQKRKEKGEDPVNATLSAELAAVRRSRAKIEAKRREVVGK